MALAKRATTAISPSASDFSPALRVVAGGDGANNRDVEVQRRKARTLAKNSRLPSA